MYCNGEGLLTDGRCVTNTYCYFENREKMKGKKKKEKKNKKEKNIWSGLTIEGMFSAYTHER